MRNLTKIAIAGLVAGLAAIAPTGTSAQTIGLPATVVDWIPSKIETLSFPKFDGQGRPNGTQKWRVVDGTGNCCENYIASTSNGRLYDFGGSYLRFTDDKGKTWKFVDTIEPLVNGEGTLTSAPNGDFVGVTWDPYSGDHALAFKYSAAEEAWYYNELILHQPFFDRPWMAVVRGPFTIAGQEVPYVTVLESNFINDVWYYSLDGINYVYAGRKDVDSLTSETLKARFSTKKDPEADYFQPQTEFGIVPLNGGGALSAEVGLFNVGSPSVVLKPPDLTWHPLEYNGGDLPPARYLQDSRGYVQRFTGRRNAKAFKLAVSRDGGKTWDEKKIPLPPQHRIEDVDLKANGKLGLTAIEIHSHDLKEPGDEDDVDRDLVYSFKVGASGAPRMKALYQLGLGDLNVGAGVGANLRFDFATVAILPDGTLAASFIDSLHQEPTLGILTD